jgi:tetrahydromethanopterin S-methyltransferase subunit E
MLVVLFTSLIKPTGIALFSASLIAILYDPIVRLRRNSIKWVIGLVSVAMLLILANRMLVTYNVMENYEKER